MEKKNTNKYINTTFVSIIIPHPYTLAIVGHSPTGRYNTHNFPVFPDDQDFFQYFSLKVGDININISKNHNDLRCKIVSGVSGLIKS